MALVQPGRAAAVLHQRVFGVTPSPNNGALSNGLNGISCPTPVRCKAVGFYNVNANLYRTLIESWNGVIWTIDPSPNLGGNDSLWGVSCVKTLNAITLSCEAVGYHTVGGFDRPLMERWNGLNWSIQATPNVGGTGTEMTAVSCLNPRSCMAVGFRTIGGTHRTLTERWNGVNWAVVASPNVGAGQNNIWGVSCISSSSCKATGWYINGPGANLTLIERWNGVNWEVVASPNPGPRFNFLYGVSCTSAAFCEAVGNWSNGGFEYTLVETWNGVNWVVTPSPNPSAVVNSLMGVSCGSPNLCEASGRYTGGRLYPSTLVENWNGVVWGVAGTANVGPYDNVLTDVSCSSPFFCASVGQYSNLVIWRTLVESGP